MILEIIALVIIILFVLSLLHSSYKTFIATPGVNPTPKIHKRDFKKDVVYLYQFPRIDSVPNLSSFCLKTETFLRAFKIPHEVIETTNLRSRNGTLPFIELNGEHIPDSDLIELRLRKHFRIQELLAEDEAHATAICRLADNHLLGYTPKKKPLVSCVFRIIVKYKASEDKWYDALMRGIPGPDFFKSLLRPVIKKIFMRKVHEKTGLTIGNFTEEEAEMLCHKDLQSIQNSIRGKFLFGDKITSADCSVFGEFASAYYPFPNKFSRIIDSHYPKIREYCDRIIEELWADDFVI
uniref:GST C-terminal domain-containing protein n=1 Tax=Caenorhabditis tropicalis TaxID=1561998 RepID=A0A1I7TFF7_9PELO